jgi:cell division protein FtsN
VITLGLCALAGLGSYELGRNWVGRTLGEAISSENVQIKAQQPAAGAANALAEDSVSPPARAKADLAPRDASDAEKQDLAAQGLSNSVAGGAGGSADTGGSAGTPSAEGAPAADSASPAASAAGSYQVTAGSFPSAAQAQQVKSALEQLGYTPTLTVARRHGKTYHQVVVGTYGDKQGAESVRKEVQAAGYEAQVSGE